MTLLDDHTTTVPRRTWRDLPATPPVGDPIPPVAAGGSPLPPPSGDTNVATQVVTSPVPPPPPPAPRRRTGRKVIAALVALAVICAVGYVIWDQNDTATAITPVRTPTSTALEALAKKGLPADDLRRAPLEIMIDYVGAKNVKPAIRKLCEEPDT